MTTCFVFLLHNTHVAYETMFWGSCFLISRFLFFLFRSFFMCLLIARAWFLVGTLSLIATEMCVSVGVAPVVIVFVVEFVGGWWQWRQWNTAAATATGVNHDLHDTVGTVEAKMSNSPSVYCAAWCRSLIADSIYFTTIKRNTGKLWANRAWHINVVDNNNHWQFNWRISR